MITGLNERLASWLDNALESEVKEVGEFYDFVDAQPFDVDLSNDINNAFVNAFTNVGYAAFLLGIRAARDPLWLMFGELKGEGHTGINAAVRDIVQGDMKETK